MIMEFPFGVCSLARKTALSSLVTGGREFKLMFSREVVLDPGVPMSSASLPAGLVSGALALCAGIFPDESPSHTSCWADVLHGLSQ